uniref:U1-type domain-containing protein n=2 Tax=Steinernema glaseri TaxID=37863 RepID=A0A1I8ABV8_9BILA
MRRDEHTARRHKVYLREQLERLADRVSQWAIHSSGTTNVAVENDDRRCLEKSEAKDPCNVPGVADLSALAMSTALHLSTHLKCAESSQPLRKECLCLRLVVSARKAAGVYETHRHPRRRNKRCDISAFGVAFGWPFRIFSFCPFRSLSCPSTRRVVRLPRAPVTARPGTPPNGRRRRARGLTARRRSGLRRMAREYKVDLESKVGKSVVINKTTPSAETGGFYCDACDCVVKDSINFLDHINGKNHQRNMGMSMKVKRSTLSDVKERLAAKKQEKLTMKREVDEEAQRQAIKEEEARMADHSKLKKVEQSRKRKKPVEDSFQQDEDISALMGFGGFGTSKKK